MLIRIKLLTFGFVIAFLLLLVRLAYWQIYKGEELAAQAREQYQDGFAIAAPRGDILAKDGSWLAATVDGWLMFAMPNELEEKAKDIAEDIAQFTVTDPENDDDVDHEIERINELLSKEGAKWVPLKRKVSTTTKERIDELKIKGIGFNREEMRAYPEASSAAHLLGFVGKNNSGEDQGYFGLEGYYDITLKGKQGFLSREADAQGIPIFLGNSKEVSAIKGVNLLTHIDKTVQFSVEERLKKGIEKYGAISGNVIVMDPSTGGILGMVSYPSYDPAEYSKYSDELFSNPVVSSSFEPGSIFKVIVMASGLDAKVVTPDKECDICSGPLKIDKYTIGTWDDKYYPNSTMTDVIKHSDNVGMAYVGRKLGANKLYDYLKAFGIGELTGVDLQGEMSPKLREKGKWNEVDLATASFGQGVAVTPLQMIRAVSAIANGGVLVKPHVVDKLIGKDWTEVIKVESGQQVISKSAAKQITEMMSEAASNGEAKWTYLRGFKVAGKTGTAQIPIAGHYDAERTIASFIGFAPYDDPKFVMLVTLREPQSSPWASETAAPLWYAIAHDLFPYFGMQPEND